MRTVAAPPFPGGRGAIFQHVAPARVRVLVDKGENQVVPVQAHQRLDKNGDAHQPNAQLPRQRHQMRVDLVLLGHALVL